ncbi:MAG: Alkyl hydroperoxide reductase [Candidatus Giovannonibacteria bacterium GW2011_GWA2_53_7]|uniref:Alkyl hydroperoxide reductase n=1 Tax=Candidatus Giovannonibacteria bacterium GW2011_GWA2_53_7 TaxID=1618650 RepID=A0A0G1Y142_9BACT|nr:MAG: Alkyl hydroperoxide reductase [Candidatus Giovannonibacteria bacterium GW2011_GWA2_53_7]
MYDLVIIGGGPAGVAAGGYAARKRLKTLFLTSEWGGQSTVSEGIQNWIGTINIPGTELAQALKNHLDAYKGDIVETKEGVMVMKVEKTDQGFTVHAEDGGKYDTKTVLIATGSSRRKLTIPGAQEYENKGITYCASCDGPLFAEKDVVVIGGGNAGFETAAQLLAYTNHVTLLQRGKEYRADEVTVSKVLANPKMTGITNTELVRIEGDKFVTKMVYKDLNDGQEKTITCDGIFVEVGNIPSTGFAKDLITLNQFGAIVIDPRTQATSVPGVWAAGDCTDILYHQNNIAAGDAVRALEDIYMYIHTR